jgi:hypothetical protein
MQGLYLSLARTSQKMPSLVSAAAITRLLGGEIRTTIVVASKTLRVPCQHQEYG